MNGLKFQEAILDRSPVWKLALKVGIIFISFFIIHCYRYCLDADLVKHSCLKDSERSSQYRKCEHEHEKTLQTSLEDSLKNLYPQS